MRRRRPSPLPYNPYLRKLAGELRKEGTLGEVLLWQEIKKRAVGYEFHRQVPLDEYIVDFFCLELMLALEVDGSTHEIEEVYLNDVRRQERLEELGVRFLRFDEVYIRQNVDDAMRMIRDWIVDHGYSVKDPECE